MVSPPRPANLSIIMGAAGLIGAISATILSAAEPPPMAKQVQIRRTEYGVPHITGESLAAAAFGFGYCQAEDHLLNIMQGILATRGTLAETFGPGEKNKHIESDFFNRQFRVHARAVASYHTLAADYRDMLAGFAAGLNYYVDRHRDQVPRWIPTVTSHDMAAYGIAGVMRFAFNRGNILKDFLAAQGVQTAMFDAVPDEAMIGSNMWAFAPSRSQSGHAMLMGNPHQPWAPVSTYYEAHMIVPGRMNFYGSTFIGRPILTSGWNEHLGWSHTVNLPDLEEIYEVDLDPAHPDHYLFDGGSVPLAREDVTIRVKEGPGLAVQSRTFWHAPLGPVVHRTPRQAYILRNVSYENFRPYEQWLRMSQTKSLDEFREAVAMNLLPMFNICYADRAGQHLLHMERHRTRLAASGPSRAAGARRTHGGHMDAHSRHGRVAATSQPAGRLRAELQFAAVLDESARAFGSGEVPAALFAQRSQPAHAAQPAIGR